MEPNKHITAILAIALAFGMGLAAYIAASERPASATPNTVSIASVSDDVVLPPANTAPGGNTGTPLPTTAVPCTPVLTVTTSANAPSGAAAPGNGREIGRFVLTHTDTPSGCVPSSTGKAVVRDVTLVVRWGGLTSAAARRAVIRNIEIRSADRKILYGRYASVTAAGGSTREARVTFRPTLAIPVGHSRELTVIANTTNASGGSSTPATVSVSVERTTVELPHRTRAGTLMY